MQGRALGSTIKVNAKRIMLSPSESGLKNKKKTSCSSTKQVFSCNTLLNSDSHSLMLPSALTLVYAFLGRIRNETRLSIGKGQSQSTH